MRIESLERQLSTEKEKDVMGEVVKLRVKKQLEVDHQKQKLKQVEESLRKEVKL